MNSSAETDSMEVDPVDSISDNDSTARNYQLELFHAALNENTIVYLQTGSGKTFIAALLIREKASEITKPLSNGGRRSVFLVPTVILAVQQANYLRRHTSLQVGEYYGSNTTDLWTGEKWQEEFENHHVLTMTAQKFLNLLNHGFVSINQINLLIVDECHSAVKDAPMKQIMKFINQSSDGSVPRILGLTAALFRRKCKPSAVSAIVKELESTMNARVRTASDIQSSLRNATKPTEVVCQCPRQRQDVLDEPVRSLPWKIKQIIDQNLTQLGRLDTELAGENVRESLEVLKEINFLTDHFGPFAANHAAELYSKKVNILKVSNVVGQGDTKNHLQIVQDTMDCIRNLWETATTCKGRKDSLYDFTTPRVHKLLDILRKFQPRPRNRPEEEPLTLCGIIFVERRSSANVLYHLLTAASMYDESLSFIKPLFTMGQSAGSSKGKIKESQCLGNKQKEIMRKFHDGKCNLLVSTSVLEEGVDVPACNLVIRFDGVKTYCDYVQSKGRARSPNALYIVMVTEDEDEFVPSKTHVLLDSLAQFHAIEQMLLHSSKSDYQEDNEQDLLWEDIVPVYFSKANGPRVTLLSALPLVNRYCATLPSEPSSILVPDWKVNEIFDWTSVDPRYLNYLKKTNMVGPDPNAHYFQCRLTLPLNSPLRDEIIGPVMPSKRLAKRIVALETCAKLHEIGELDDEHLLPRKKRSVDVSEMESVNHNRPPTFRLYLKQIPHVFQNGPPKPETPICLYLLTYKMVQYNGQHPNLDPESLRWRIGFITTHRLPSLNPFHIFTRVGQISVGFVEINDQLVLDQTSMDLCKKFQRYLCEEILDTKTSDILFEPNSASRGYLIVPIRLADYHVDTGLIEKALNSPVNRHTLKSMEFQPLDPVEADRFEDAMVTSRHRTFESFFYVDAVSTLTPESPFPNDGFPSYSEYYRIRHNYQIENVSQRLLKVSKESEQRNALMPKYVSRKSVNTATESQPRKSMHLDREKGAVHFVPELCIVHPCPASLWRQAIWIPSIFHRLEKLLLANEFREKLIRGMKLDSPNIQSSIQWDPIQLTGSNYNPGRQSSSEVGKQLDQLEYNIKQIGPEININDDIAEAVELAEVDTLDQVPSIEALQENSVWNIDLYDLKDEIADNAVQNCSMKLERLDSPGTTSSIDNLHEKEDAPVHESAISFDEIRVVFDPRGPSPGHILQALTLAVTNEAFNLERLETVGDSFLKLATSIYLHCNSPSNFHEGMLSELRSQKISNQNLHRLGENIGLPRVMAATKFAPSENWFPPGYIAIDPVDQEDQGEQSQRNPRTWQKISDKSVADALEALIGTYLTVTGIKGALKFMKYVEIEVPDPGQGPLCFGGTIPHPLLSNLPEADRLLDDMLTNYDSFERRINYTFRNRYYLLQAFCHASYYPNRLTGCYQRLEFLGDAVFDYLITRFLYEDPKQYSPGALSDLRSALVNNSTFAVLAVRHEFHRYFKHMAMDLQHTLDKFIQRQEENQHQILDDYFLIGDEEDKMASNVEVPKVLGDIFESVAGAVFLDSNMSLDAVWNVFYPLLRPEIESFTRNIPISPIRKLHELEPGRVKLKKMGKLEDGRVCVAAEVVGKGIFKGVGKNVRIARCTAAKFALRQLEASQLEK